MALRAGGQKDGGRTTEGGADSLKSGGKTRPTCDPPRPPFRCAQTRLPTPPRNRSRA